MLTLALCRALSEGPHHHHHKAVKKEYVPMYISNECDPQEEVRSGNLIEFAFSAWLDIGQLGVVQCKPEAAKH